MGDEKKQTKVFYLTKRFIQTELGITRVESDTSPIVKFNNFVMNAGLFKWSSLDDLKRDDMFCDVRAMNGIIYFYEMNLNEFSKVMVNPLTENDEVQFVPPYIFVDNPNEAEEFWIRIYTEHNRKVLTDA